MPKLVLTVNRPVDAAVKATLATVLTELTAEHLNKKPEVTMVNIRDDHSDWYINGEKNNRATTSYDLIVQITTGTNTDQEKEAWLAATSELLNKELGLSHSLPNYISIFDVDGKSWGFNGLSQYARLNK
ncbi:MAG: 4-oxalocrotonate tautomerase [Alteromonadaceae bacterium]|jgi:4-oxalocrotonate tautomerase